MVSRSNSYSTPGLSARRCADVWIFVRCMPTIVACAGTGVPSKAPGQPSSSGHVVERVDDLGGQLELLDGQRAAQLGGGAGADDRAR